MSSGLRLADVVAALEARYDPQWAAEWDAVGLVCGDPDAEVRSVLFAVDPVDAVVSEAIESGADLLVTHHPLFLTPVHGVPATDPKGRVVHRLVRAGCALHVAHTNADVARPGVSDALADAIGLVDTVALEPSPADPLDQLVTYVPLDAVETVVDALSDAGAGAIGDYTRCSFAAEGTGTFLPGEGARPALGRVGRLERVREARVEMTVPRHRRDHVVAALRAAHPYEEPAFAVIEGAVGAPNGRGSGRVGRLSRPEPLATFARRVAGVLPATAVGVRATGIAAARVETVAVCGGSGGSYIDQAYAAGADAYVTADLRHHPTSEALEAAVPGRPGSRRPMALLDVTHWASEWPWLAGAADALRGDLEAGGATVSTSVSSIVTDPWTQHAPAGGTLAAVAEGGVTPRTRSPY
jgi:dinuclear metal center YbgI/SA1388 family protein